jgi:hypothetical protein
VTIGIAVGVVGVGVGVNVAIGIAVVGVVANIVVGQGQYGKIVELKKLLLLLLLPCFFIYQTCI